jgi:hypothetical protein
MKTIAIMVQEYHKDKDNYVYCKNVKNPKGNFTLHYNYISKFSTPLEVGKAYLVEHMTEPSECGEYTNHKINVLSELSMRDILSML